VQNFISIGGVISEPMGFENQNLPFVWATALTIVYALTCYTMIKCLYTNGMDGQRHLTLSRKKLQSTLKRKQKLLVKPLFARNV